MLVNLTFGVLGLGSIGTRHAINLVGLGRDILTFDPSEIARRHAQSKGIPVTDIREDVLERSQAVVIASPNIFHFQDMKDVIASNCHVFVEKPLAHVTKGVDSVLEEAAKKNLRVFAGLNLRFHPAVTAAKSLLLDNAIGQPLWGLFQSSHYLPSWRPDQDYRKGYAADPVTGGVLFDIIHEFDLASYLLGPAKTLFAAARNSGAIEILAEDCADIVLRHESKVHSNLHLDYVSRPTRRSCEIGGSTGNLHINIVKRGVILTNCEGELIQKETFNTTTSADDYVAEMVAFIECVEQNVAPVCDGYMALETLKQVILARQLCGLPAP